MNWVIITTFEVIAVILANYAGYEKSKKR